MSYLHRQEAFDGNGLRPLSPCHLRASRSGGDLALRWIRRTRIGGDSWTGLDVPLGESSEAYVVRVVRGGEIRRDAIVPLREWSYPAALRAADGVGAPFEIHVAQLSDSFGAGPFARIAINE